MNETQRNFSAFLRRVRGERSQSEFAAFLGISSQATYSRYEGGQIPDGEVLLKIASKLGVTIDDLLIPRHQDKAEFAGQLRDDLETVEAIIQEIESKLKDAKNVLGVAKITGLQLGGGKSGKRLS